MISVHLFLGLFDAGHVVEGDVGVLLALDAVAAAAERHQHAARAAAQVADKEEVEEAHEQQDRQQPVQQPEHPDPLLGVLVLQIVSRVVGSSTAFFCRVVRISFSRSLAPLSGR